MDIINYIEKAESLLQDNKYKKSLKMNLEEKYKKIQEDIDKKSKELDVYLRASSLIGTVSDNTIKETLGVITEVINRALAVLFPEDPRTIRIEHKMYRNAYPHFVVVLETGVDKKVRKFSQSGSGLAQMISFLFTVALIDTRKARRLIIMDEVLNGLHPTAKKMMRDLMLAVSKTFQFIIVEYDYDVGKQYEVIPNGKTSNVIHYDSDSYYYDLKLKTQSKEDDLK